MPTPDRHIQVQATAVGNSPQDESWDEDAVQPMNIVLSADQYSGKFKRLVQQARSNRQVLPVAERPRERPPLHVVRSLEHDDEIQNTASKRTRTGVSTYEVSSIPDFNPAQESAQRIATRDEKQLQQSGRPPTGPVNITVIQTQVPNTKANAQKDEDFEQVAAKNKIGKLKSRAEKATVTPSAPKCNFNVDITANPLHTLAGAFKVKMTDKMENAKEVRGEKKSPKTRRAESPKKGGNLDAGWTSRR
ncbi:hypothetical protein R1sor_012203 [Riccia sorocarpa]|uniref:Uncharacterized protein n=1 Tax=Riccia sorocarpa TaxID=122646 RepID=A0ABD3I732_9MARC